MTIFEQLKDITEDKKNILSSDVELEKEFVPYMVQRWLSFYNNSFIPLLNNSINRSWKSIDDKQTWYKLFLGIIPKSKYRNIKYIKKNKEKENKLNIDDEMVQYLAVHLELSKSEIKEYLSSGLVDVKQLKKQIM